MRTSILRWVSSGFIFNYFLTRVYYSNTAPDTLEAELFLELGLLLLEELGEDLQPPPHVLRLYFFYYFLTGLYYCNTAPDTLRAELFLELGLLFVEELGEDRVSSAFFLYYFLTGVYYCNTAPDTWRPSCFWSSASFLLKNWVRTSSLRLVSSAFIFYYFLTGVPYITVVLHLTLWRPSCFWSSASFLLKNWVRTSSLRLVSSAFIYFFLTWVYFCNTAPDTLEAELFLELGLLLVEELGEGLRPPLLFIFFLLEYITVILHLTLWRPSCFWSSASFLLKNCVRTSSLRRVSSASFMTSSRASFSRPTSLSRSPSCPQKNRTIYYWPSLVYDFLLFEVKKFKFL